MPGLSSWLALAAVCLLTACRTRYQVTLSNSAKYTAAGKPRLVEGSYHFKDAVTHQEMQVPVNRVRDIEALPIEESKGGFTPASRK